MTAAEVQALIDEIPCDLCNSPPGLAMYMVAAALADLANGEDVPMTTQELITQSNCIQCLVPPGMLPYFMIAALRNISGSGGGSGGAGSVGSGSPEGVVTATPGTIYADTSASPAVHLWVKESGVGNTGWNQQT